MEILKADAYIGSYLRWLRGVSPRDGSGQLSRWGGERTADEDQASDKQGKIATSQVRFFGCKTGPQCWMSEKGGEDSDLQWQLT